VVGFEIRGLEYVTRRVDVQCRAACSHRGKDGAALGFKDGKGAPASIYSGEVGLLREGGAEGMAASSRVAIVSD
jgi:hypothetical protein